MVIAIALAVAFPNLPDVSALVDYRPILPLRVYSSDGQLIGEFGEERRNLTRLKDMPKVMTDAVLAIEDTRFYEHGGVDYKGMVRAAWPTWATSRAREHRRSRCRSRAMSTCRPKRPTPARSMRCC
jgi:membrane carboxypeptidase/penicillin-binding protein